MPTSNVPTITRVAIATTANTLGIAANASRKWLRIIADTQVEVKICEGATASATAFTNILSPGEKWEPESTDEVYTGVINFIAPIATGSMQFIEYT